MTAPAATMGTAATILGPGPKEMFDRGNGIEVDLLHPSMTLPGGGDAALVAGRNLALIGEELIAFGTATQIGPVRWRLSDLVRGRYGSDGAIGTHGSDERFVLIETGRMRPIDLPASAIVSTARVQAIGPGDDGVAAMAGADVVGRALRPPAPVAITSRPLADGTWAIDWIRRSRTGWAWLDGTDAPLGESGERYRIVIAGGGIVRTVETSVPAYAYTPAEQMADGVTTGSAVSVTIAQLGTFGASLPPATYGFIA